MRALVTGGAGFIGSHLVDFLLERDWTVCVLDNFSTGRMENLQRHPNLIIEGTAIQRQRPELPRASCRLENIIEAVDVVFHLAAIVGVHRVIKWPLRTIEENIESTAAVLHFAAKHRKPTIITSSSEVYGSRAGMAIQELSEEDPLIVPPPTEQRYGYAAAKLVDEYTALAHHRESNFEVVVARIFNTIGPRQRADYGMVVPTFIDQALSGRPITVCGDGRQTRSFTWVGDVVRALCNLVRKTEAYGQIVNVGNFCEVPISGLATIVRNVTGSSSPIEYIQRKELYGIDFPEIQTRRPNLRKIKSLIEYQPRQQIHGMIEDIVKWRTHVEVSTAGG